MSSGAVRSVCGEFSTASAVPSRSTASDASLNRSHDWNVLWSMVSLLSHACCTRFRTSRMKWMRLRARARSDLASSSVRLPSCWSWALYWRISSAERSNQPCMYVGISVRISLRSDSRN